MMRAVVLNEEGGPEVLVIEDVDRPEPGPGEVRVRLKAASLNHLDIWIRKGMPSVTKPRVTGADGAGIINAVGEGIDEQRTGDNVLIDPAITCGKCRACTSGNTVACRQFHVLGEHRAGTHAEYVIVPVENVHITPVHLDDESAAALPLTFATSWRMLHTRAQLQPGERLLIWGASSGVGSAAIVLAKKMGAEIIAVSRSDYKLKICKVMGADHVINMSTDDVVKSVKEITGGEGVNVVFDHLGDAVYKNSLRMLAIGGRFVTCGATTGANPPAAITSLFWKQLSVLGSTMATKDDFASMVRFVRLHELMPRVDRVFDLEEIVDAHTYLEGAQQVGKVVINLS
uniref:Alcohol dehydrogenase n=1 Tax=uncultured bacterium W5-102b TaxID=1130996 RepID=H9BWK4_9BACT|nr:alcohol dehydrogenase [uncultured bacterium W5-102b]